MRRARTGRTAAAASSAGCGASTASESMVTADSTAFARVRRGFDAAASGAAASMVDVSSLSATTVGLRVRRGLGVASGVGSDCVPLSATMDSGDSTDASASVVVRRLAIFKLPFGTPNTLRG